MASSIEVFVPSANAVGERVDVSCLNAARASRVQTVTSRNESQAPPLRRQYRHWRREERRAGR